MYTDASPLTADELRVVLDQLRYQVERIEEDRFSIVYTTGLKASLVTYGEPGKLRSLQLRAGFTGFNRIEMRHINTWNRRYRFSKAYLDGDNDPVLEFDLWLEGASPELIMTFVREFEDSCNLFFSYIRMIDAELVE
ncbi:MAG TPA: YbjN domain-containing protein [Meiothermus sp.]|jgi:hypothetical protein|nr:YbjN domain-containing protein [Meiothermus sp.]